MVWGEVRTEKEIAAFDQGAKRHQARAQYSKKTFGHRPICWLSEGDYEQERLVLAVLQVALCTTVMKMHDLQEVS